MLGDDIGAGRASTLSDSLFAFEQPKVVTKVKFLPLKAAHPGRNDGAGR
jgi:hypothetical protein